MRQTQQIILIISKAYLIIYDFLPENDFSTFNRFRDFSNKYLLKYALGKKKKIKPNLLNFEFKTAFIVPIVLGYAAGSNVTHT